MKRDPIRRIELADGRVRYRFVIDAGRKPDGRRDQRTYTFDKLSEARAERARIISERARGAYVRPSKATVGELAETWLAGKRNLKASTARTYSDALKLLTGKIGHVPAQGLNKAHLDRVVAELLATGRRVGTVESKQLSARTINLALTVLQAVLDDAVRQGLLVRNVVALVERPRQTRTETSTWTADQAQTFLARVAGHRLAVAWHLSLMGLRRGEVLGLRWSDIDLDRGTLTVANTRNYAGDVVVEGEPKTARSARTLPLTAELLALLTALQLRQMEESEAAGEAYRPCALCGGAHVVANELGQPYRPEWFSDEFARLSKDAGLPRIRLHDARHTCGTLMHLCGVPVAVISAWLGHASGAFTMRTYVHSQDDALMSAAATLRDALAASPVA